jgi:putative tricarboxylic transport membrane protein
VQRIDRWVGLALAGLGAAVFWSSRAFPAVPGQKVGAGFLPALVGIGLVIAALALVARSLRAAPAAAADDTLRGRLGAPAVLVGVALFYIVAADRLGFLIVAPLGLAAMFLALGVRPRPALLWALAGTAVVHLAFYKLLRVPLPWGVLRPFY